MTSTSICADVRTVRNDGQDQLTLTSTLVALALLGGGPCGRWALLAFV